MRYTELLYFFLQSHVSLQSFQIKKFNERLNSNTELRLEILVFLVNLNVLYTPFYLILFFLFLTF